MENISLAVRNLENVNLKGEINPMTLPNFKRLKAEASNGAIKQASNAEPMFALSKPDKFGLRLSMDGGISVIADLDTQVERDVKTPLQKD